MKIYKSTNVFDEALNRIRWLFDEFPNVIVSYSGGKDSTVIYELAMIVAREKKRLPLKVLFVDQEAEWELTIDQVRNIMYSSDVEPLWLQIPFRIENGASSIERFLICWEEARKDDWIREKDEIAIKENTYGIDHWYNVFNRFLKHRYPGVLTCYLAGVRTEESPSRFCGLTSVKTYKWVTWGKNAGGPKEQHYTLYPIYDWAVTDVWKAIHDNGWDYNKIYDVMYQYGVKLNNMRVSSLHHETAVRSLWYLQEVEPETYVKLVKRLKGVDMAGKMGVDNYFVRELPFMFASWKEYRDYLMKYLMGDDRSAKLLTIFKRHEKMYVDQIGSSVYKVHVQSILANDYLGIKIQNWERTLEPYLIRKGERSWKT